MDRRGTPAVREAIAITRTTFDAWRADQVDDWRQDRIGCALDGTNPTVLSRLPAAFAVIGDVHWLLGYCVPLTDDPAVTRLSELPKDRRLRYLESIDRLARAVERACADMDGQFRRVNI